METRNVTQGDQAGSLLFCSFHTPDDYYSEAAARLRATLADLAIPHRIVQVDKNPDEEWIEICRKKIPFLHQVCQDNPDKRIFWIDVDCDIDYLPGFVSGFSADIIGFQRGFNTPLRIGYGHSARFWEPCFWGINTTPAARAYVADAARASASMTIRATDDYFFEEAWRRNADRLSFQVIPSTMLGGRISEHPGPERPFFFFGSSGHVASFKGLAAQHVRNKARVATPGPQGPQGVRSIALNTARQVQSALPQRLAVPLRRLSDRIGVTEFLSPSLPGTGGGLSPGSIYNIIHEAREGRADAVRQRMEAMTTRRLPSATDQAVTAAAEAFLEHARPESPAQPLRLHWWDKPYPGNFGDWLSPLILQTVTGRPILFQRHDEADAPPHLMAVGSVGRFAQSSSILVGTGISRSDATLAPDATYVSLRGPYSAQAVAAAGGPRVERFGDPAVLLPRLFPVLAPARGNGRLALVRHFSHRTIALRLPEQVEELSILRSGRSAILDLIRRLHDYDAVLTSAMHVYIACHAYGLPVGLITFEGFEDAVHGDRVKYRDYAAGVGLPERLPVPVGPDLRRRALADLVEHDRIPRAAMDEVEAALAEAVALYDQRQPELRQKRTA